MTRNVELTSAETGQFQYHTNSRIAGDYSLGAQAQQPTAAGTRTYSRVKAHRFPEAESGTQANRQNLTRRLILLFAAQPGAVFVSLMALAGAIWLLDSPGWWSLGMLGTLVGLRAFYAYLRISKPVLAGHIVPKEVGQVVKNDVNITVVLLAACYIFRWPINPQTMVAFFAGSTLLQLGHMALAKKALQKIDATGTENRLGTATHQALIVGTGDNARKVADMILESPELDTRLAGFLDFRRNGLWRYRDVPMVGTSDDLRDIIANSHVDALFMAPEPDDLKASRNVFDVADEMGVSVYVMPNLYYPRHSRIRPSYVAHLPTLLYRSDPEDNLAQWGKRMIDRVGAAFGLLLSLPIILFTALAIKLDSRGPVFFRQIRAGQNGKPFILYKFRTMGNDAEERKATLLKDNEMSGPVFKIKRDPRVTRVGKILRKYSIDEIPQFWNVLKGDMSLVGPRPPLPSEVSKYEPWQHRKLSVKPGLTCLWQVNGRNAIDFDDWMRLDLTYIDRWSLWLDAKILVKTLPAVIRGTGH